MACFLHQLSFILYIFHILYLFFSLLSFLFFKKNNPTLSPPPPARQHLFNVAILWSPAAFDVFSCVWGCNSTTDAVGSGSARARESLQSLLPPHCPVPSASVLKCTAQSGAQRAARRALMPNAAICVVERRYSIYARVFMQCVAMTTVTFTPSSSPSLLLHLFQSKSKGCKASCI